MPRLLIKDGSEFEMNYEIHPGLARENVLFIHGNIASNRWWYPAEEVWRREAKGKSWSGSLIYGEFRGAGQSSAPRNEAEVTVDRFAEDYISLIRDLKCDPVHLVGHSFGGTVAALMLAKAPELFRRAVLVDPVGPTGVRFDPSMIQNFEAMKKDKELTSQVIGSTIYKNDPNSDFFRQVVCDDAFSAVKSVGHLVLKALDGIDIRSILTAVKSPTLVLHGEHDQLLSVDDSKKLAQCISGAKFEIIPDQGHCVNVESPEKFVGILNKFLFS